MPSGKEILIISIKEIQQSMEEGEEIPLFSMVDSSDKGYEIATYLTREKIGCARFPKKDSTGTYTFDKRTSFSKLDYDDFAQATIALGKRSQVVDMLSKYLATKRMGKTWPFGSHEGSDEAFRKLTRL